MIVINIFLNLKFRSDDVIKPFEGFDHELYYLEEFGNGCKENDKLETLKHIAHLYSAASECAKCHSCSTRMRHLFRVASDIPNMNQFNYLKKKSNFDQNHQGQFD